MHKTHAQYEKYLNKNHTKKKIIKSAVIFAAGMGLGLLASYVFSGPKDEVKVSQLTPTQLEQVVYKMDSEQKAKVVHNIATEDHLNARGAYSARVLFLESYLRQKEDE